MKFKIQTPLCLLAIFFFSTHLKAQDDDPNTGWYVDGYKVSTVSCYNFDKLQFVVPYSPEMESYDHISIRFWRGPKEVQFSGVKLYTLSAVQGLKKGNYLVFSVITREDAIPLIENGYPYGAPSASQTALDFNINRWDCTYQVVDIGDGRKKETPGPDVILNATLYGLTQTEIEEVYDNACSCIKKIPKYTATKITKSYPLTLTGRIWKKWNAPLNTEEVCSYTGTKVDFSTLGMKAETTAPAKIEAKTNAATKTTSASATPKSTVLTTPYSEKYENGKIKVQGQKTKTGEQEGTWKYFDENGKLERIENYTKGIANGEWKYYEEGKLSKTEIYKEGEVMSSTEVE